MLGSTRGLKEIYTEVVFETIVIPDTIPVGAV
jgi:hypothetical protein